VSPTAESPGYIMESEPEMEPKENDGDDKKSKGDSIDYPTSKGDNDDDGDDFSEDDADNEDEEESSDTRVFLRQTYHIRRELVSLLLLVDMR
nr:hypothetical protein [Tanacetum cinerariifolium]